MNLRERFHEVMNFNTTATTMKWEFGYWGQTLHNWYCEGLPKRQYPALARERSTPTATLYQAAWTCQSIETMPPGIAVMAGGLYWPTQGFPVDHDVRSHFGMDGIQRLVDVNLLFHPMFDVEIHQNDGQSLVYTDVDGVKRTFLKETATIPSGMDWPIKDRKSWEKLKEERLNLNDIKGRFPNNWAQLAEEYRTRDYPLALGGYPHGFFGTLAHLIGYENLFVWYLEDPELVHDMLKTFTDLWIAVYSEVLSQTSVDHFQIWEDISFGKGSMISPACVREFMCPYIKRTTDFLKARGVTVILLDTDGDCSALIPLFIESGVTGMYPFEAHCGMDIVKVRKQYPRLQILGGIAKSEIQKGKASIDQILKPAEAVLKTGGYIPFGDHFIPPEVDWENFQYYRTSLNDMIDRAAKG
jgi:uroporphyrinogen decarboxylase